MAVSLRVPLDGLVYQRRFSAEIDVLAEDRLRVRGRMEDHRIALVHDWTVRTPTYEVVAASGITVAEGQTTDNRPALALLNGVRIGPGFSRRVGDALGESHSWRAEHLQLALEMARVAQQIYQFPGDFDRLFPMDRAARSPQALLSWQKDRAYMPGLADSCYTYADASVEVLTTKVVVSHVDATVTRPQVGTQAVFRREKWLTIRREGTADQSRFTCESGMRDNLHDIVVRFVVSADGSISSATSSALRLPYSGLCETAQTRTSSLDGERVTSNFVILLAQRLGGSTGCTHLFDLSTDCLRLFAFDS